MGGEYTFILPPAIFQNTKPSILILSFKCSASLLRFLFAYHLILVKTLIYNYANGLAHLRRGFIAQNINMPHNLRQTTNSKFCTSPPPSSAANGYTLNQISMIVNSSKKSTEPKQPLFLDIKGLSDKNLSMLISGAYSFNICL